MTASSWESSARSSSAGAAFSLPCPPSPGSLRAYALCLKERPRRPLQFAHAPACRASSALSRRCIDAARVRMPVVRCPLFNHTCPQHAPGAAPPALRRAHASGALLLAEIRGGRAHAPAHLRARPLREDAPAPPRPASARLRPCVGFSFVSAKWLCFVFRWGEQAKLGDPFLVSALIAAGARLNGTGGETSRSSLSARSQEPE